MPNADCRNSDRRVAADSGFMQATSPASLLPERYYRYAGDRGSAAGPWTRRNGDAADHNCLLGIYAYETPLEIPLGAVGPRSLSRPRLPPVPSRV